MKQTTFLENPQFFERNNHILICIVLVGMCVSNVLKSGNKKRIELNIEAFPAITLQESLTKRMKQSCEGQSQFVFYEIFFIIIFHHFFQISHLYF